MRDHVLNQLGLQAGTDKSDVGQDYLHHYDRNFHHLRDQNISLLEIGVFNGSSIRMWEKYFSFAKIVGIDVEERCKIYASDQTEIEIGSQTDVQFLAEIGSRYQPTIVIDDGSHMAAHNLITFNALFEFVQPGGFYVVEDLYLHYPESSRYREGASQLPADYFAGMAMKLAQSCSGIVPFPQSDAGIVKNIDRIEFFRRGVLIQKKLAVDQLEVFKKAERLVHSWPDSTLWHALSTFALANNLGLERAENASRAAIALDPNQNASIVRLIHILELQRRHSEALAEARALEGRTKGDSSLAKTISRLEQKTGSNSGV